MPRVAFRVWKAAAPIDGRLDFKEHTPRLGRLRSPVKGPSSDPSETAEIDPSTPPMPGLKPRPRLSRRFSLLGRNAIGPGILPLNRPLVDIQGI